MFNLHKFHRSVCRRIPAWLFVFTLAPALLLVTGCSDEKKEQQRSLPQVGCITLEPKDIPITVDLPGRASSYHTAEVRPQVSGIILKRMFDEGSDVEQGQQLYQIDPAVYEAAYETALANQKRAEAGLANSKLLADRYSKVVASNAVSKQEYDDAMAAYRTAQAELAAAKAATKSAKINLDYTRVFAPVSGRIGISSVTEGALVTAAQATPLAYIQQMNVMLIDIAQSSSDYLRLQRNIQSGLIIQDELGEIPVTLIMEDGKEAYEQAVLKLYDIDVDQSTGSITMRAQIKNDNRLILPGMFVRARVKQGVIQGGLLVPQQAVQRNQRGQPYVQVVDKDGNVEQRVFSTVNGVYENSWVITPGLSTPEGKALTIKQADERRAESRAVHGLLAGEKIIMEGSMQLLMTGATRVTPVEYRRHVMKSPSEVLQQVRAALDQENQ